MVVIPHEVAIRMAVVDIILIVVDADEGMLYSGLLIVTTYIPWVIDSSASNHMTSIALVLFDVYIFLSMALWSNVGPYQLYYRLGHPSHCVFAKPLSCLLLRSLSTDRPWLHLWDPIVFFGVFLVVVAVILSGSGCGPGRGPRRCTHCNQKNHTVNRCRDLHGHPVAHQASIPEDEMVSISIEEYQHFLAT
ncbi:hypothetical protein Acr_00g0080390 [Actinidia rufa]|uniref:Uncharacterized protein n=1 Tax=Actinidia rufa TaxID=165716 RepID=A0A7J0DU15_9ERIC|nr:hypothetical protein Acr_00g0080390 [Actinidia rufa]